MADLDYEELNKQQRYTHWAVFSVEPGALPTDRSEVIAQAQEFFAEVAQEGVVTLRGSYLVSGIQANGDFLLWSVAEHYSPIQEVFNRFRRETTLGSVAEVTWTATGLHRPAEFNRRHLPSFVMGEDPCEWITLYPFVRSYEWYLMDPKERSQILREHGMQAADYPDVRANTVEAFALGDYEFVLCFEAPELHRIVDLMHHMRYTRARLHVRKEVPFYTGHRLEIGELITQLP